MSKLVLVIDDDPIQHEVVAAALAGVEHIRLLRAMNGLEAIREIDAAQSPIQLMICDLHMPDFNGIELINALGARHSQTPIIFVSSAAHHIVRSAYVLGDKVHLKIVGMLAKPLDFPKLLEMAQRVLNPPARKTATA